jgi:hypothetical protein
MIRGKQFMRVHRVMKLIAALKQLLEVPVTKIKNLPKFKAKSLHSKNNWLPSKLNTKRIQKMPVKLTNGKLLTTLNPLKVDHSEKFTY